MSTRWFFALATALVVAGLSGCESCCRRPAPVAAYCPNCVDQIQPPPARMVPVPLTPAPPVQGVAPATWLPPAGSSPPAALGTPVPPAPLPNPPAPVDAPPERREASRPPAGDSREPPAANVPGKRPPEVEDRREAPDPIDIPSYAMAIPNVFSGLKPFPDGIDWLKGRGFKSVLHLKQPGEDDTAVRRLFEKRGLRFISLEASPARLTKELYEQFVRIVTDTANHPLYVFDRDRTVASGMWYLYFRAHDKLSDEQARTQAQQLGLRFDEDPEHKAMWLAVQTLLKKLEP
jgi:hypothetical protein